MSVVEYSIIGERASISSVQWNVCMYSFFYGTFTRASTNYIDTARRTAHFTRVREALTNAVDSSIAHTLWKKRKQIKKKAGTGERSQTE